MGWGGKREGAGRKKPGAAAGGAMTAAKPKNVLLEASKRAMTFDTNFINQIIETSNAHAKTAARRPEMNPFQIPAFPKAAIPSKKSHQLAMDDSMNWAAGQWSAGVLNGIGAEGLLFLGYPYLAELAQRPEYRIISETIATEATRKWIKFKGTGKEDKTEKIKQLNDYLDALQARDHYADLATQDGFFGRSHLFHAFGDEDLDNAKELIVPIGNGRDAMSKGKVNKENPLRSLKTVEAVWTYPMTYNAVNPLKKDWYNPQFWYVMGREIHCSRLLTFIGHPVPDLLKPAYAFGGLSLSQMAKPYVDIWLTTRQSVADLIHSFSVMVLMTDLQTILSPGNANGLIARAALFNALRDNQGLMIVNKATEDFKNVSASLSGLHELQAQAQEHMASVARIPLVKFTGISPSGLNASSEGEMRAFYDTIAAYQNKFMRPNLTKTIDFAMLSLWDEVDQEITFDFEPLWEMTEKERGEKRKAEAETGQIHIDSGVISPAEERGRIINDPDSAYQGLNPEDVPDLSAEEEAGLEPEGGRPDPKASGEPDKGGEGGATDAAILPFAEPAEKTLYLHRPLKNASNFLKWARAAGFEKTLPADDIHVTIAFSRTPVDWDRVPGARATLKVPARGDRVVKPLGDKGAVVLSFQSSELQRRWNELRNKVGTSWDYPTYQPHVTITYDAEGVDLASIEPYDGPLEFGPEEGSEIKEKWFDKVKLVGDEFREDDHPRADNGQFGSGGGGKSKPQRSPAEQAVRSYERQPVKAPQYGGAAPFSFAEWRASLRPKPKSEGEPGKADSVVVFSAGEASPVKELNGVAFSKYDPPADWADVSGQADVDEPELPEVPRGMELSSGLLIREKDGRVWMMRPKGGYGGYHQTFPKGRAEDGLSLQANAIKEGFEETGLKAKIVGFAGDFEGDTTITRFYIAEREGGDPAQAGEESEGVVLAPPARLKDFLNRERDRKIANAMTGDAAFNEADHPRDPDGKFGSGGGSGGGSSGKASLTSSFEKAKKIAKSMLAKGVNPTTKPEDFWSQLSSAETEALINHYGTGKETQEAMAVVATPEHEAQWKALEKEVPAPKPHDPVSKASPLKMGDLKKVGPQMGSNPGGVYELPGVGEFYVKQAQTPAHAKNELLAAKLFALTGSPTLEYRKVKDGTHVATKLQKLDKKNVKDLSPEERKAAQADFVTQAWLANYDAAGTGGDNIGVIDGKVTPLDFGGALEYRAQGKPKGDAFGIHVGELKTMLDPSKSPDAAALYGEMSDDQMKESAQKVVNLSDEEIDDAVASMGGSTALAQKMIARKNDIAKQFNLEFEGKHKRGAHGEFIAMPGGEEGPSGEIKALLDKPPIAGGNYRRALAKAIKEVGENTESGKKLKANLISSWGKTWSNAVKKGEHDKADKIAKKIKSLGATMEQATGSTTPFVNQKLEPAPKSKTVTTPTGQKVELEELEPVKPKAEKPKPEPKKVGAAEAAGLKPTDFANFEEWTKANSSPEDLKKIQAAKADPEKKQYPTPTEAQISKAKKNVKLQLQYVPGAPQGNPEAQKLVDAFNKKWEGVEVSNEPDKVKKKLEDFHDMTEAMVPLMSAEQQKAAAAVKEQQEQQAKANAEAAEKAAENAKKAKAEAEKAAKEIAAKNKEIIDSLGISDVEALGFTALAKMIGGSQSDVIKSFKQYEEEAKGYGYPITGFQCALIKNYTNGGYRSINSGLRDGVSWTAAQQVYVKLMNKALKAMPTFTGVTKRGTSLTAAKQKDYVVGNVVEERAFTSTSPTKPWSGNTQFTINAIGKRGAHVKKLSSHGSENEVVFAARTFFHVDKVETKNGTMHVTMTEIENE